MSEGRHQESAAAYAGLEQRCLLSANDVCVNAFLHSFCDEENVTSEQCM